MSFQQGLSGLNISSKALDAIGNNVANANTVGYKSAQAQFADVFAASLSGGGAGQVGIGAAVNRVAQTFSQGNVTATNNSLDLAINGNGLFRMSNNGVISYTRNGQFQVDKEGYVVNGAGLRLTGYKADATGLITPGQFEDLQLVTTNIAPKQTTASTVQLNLDSRSSPPSLMTAGSATGTISVAGGGPPIGSTNDQLNVTVDGVTPLVPPTITIPSSSYGSLDDVAAAIENAINTHPDIAAANALVDVYPDSGNKLVIESRSRGSLGSQGLGSTVTVSAVAGDNCFANFFGGVTTTAGADNFDPAQTGSYSFSTAQSVYDSLGNQHNMTLYFCKTAQANSTTTTWQTYASVDGVLEGPEITTSTYSVTTPFGGSVLDNTDSIEILVAGMPATTVTLDYTALWTAPGSAFTSRAQAAEVLNASIVGTPLDGIVSVADVGGRLVFTATNSASVALGAGGTVTADQMLGAGAALSAVSLASTTVTPTPELLTFDQYGALTGAYQTGTWPLDFRMSTGAANLTFDLSFQGTSQYGIGFGVNQLIQDGFTSGRLSSLEVSSDGILQGRYSNGQSRAMGQLVLANFNNANGLQSLGGNQWIETAESGQPIPGTPGQGSLGLVQSMAVEEANVDLTAELVQMITQQRVYQANAQTIKTQDQVLSTLVNLR